MTLSLSRSDGEVTRVTARDGADEFPIRRFQHATGWTPRVGLDAGLRRLHDWLKQSRDTTDLTLVARSRVRARPRLARGTSVAARQAP